MRKLLIVISTIMLLGLITACENGESSSIDLKSKPRVKKIGVQESNLEETVKQMEEEIEKNSKGAKIGDKISLSGQEFTVIKLEKSDGNEKYKPAPGRYFVIITAKIKNTGEKNIPYKYHYFSAVNDKGEQLQLSISPIDAATALVDGEIAPGESVTGTLTFELPRRDTLVKLKYVNSRNVGANVNLQ